MKPGDTFLGKVVGRGQHLHVVLSHPSDDNQVVVMTMVSTFDENSKNDACVLRAGDHPFIKHDTYVVYELAILCPIDKLRDLEKNGVIKPMPPFSPEVVERILAGADKLFSRLPNDCWLLLDDQKLFP